MIDLAQKTAARSRRLERGEFDAARALIDRAMRPGAELSMADDFPLLVGRFARAERRVIADADGRLVAHAAMRNLPVMAPTIGERVMFANIGAVATDVSARGAGHASAIVRELMDGAQRAGAVAAILWTSLEGFYERLGFIAVPGESRFTVDRSRLPRDPSIEARRMNANDVQSLLRLRGLDPAPILRTPAEARVLFALPRARTYVAAQSGRIAAYVVIGKGLDFADMAHEWAGEPSLVAALLREAMFAEGLEKTTIIGPSRDRGFRAVFAPVADREDRAPMAWIAPLDRARLARIAGGEVPGESDTSLVHRVFVRENENGDDRSPPLPLYVFGLDSM